MTMERNKEKKERDGRSYKDGGVKKEREERKEVGRQHGLRVLLK